MELKRKYEYKINRRLELASDKEFLIERMRGD